VFRARALRQPRQRIEYLFDRRRRDHGFAFRRRIGDLAGVRHIFHEDHPEIGMDGKGQFNLYDSDGTCIELMNFHATEKPCCSPFAVDSPDE
jgi:hypothetical protein